LAAVDDLGMEGEIITLQDVFRFDHSLGFDEEGVPSASSSPPGCVRRSSTSSLHTASTRLVPLAFEHVRDATA
jgi:hypothetical protein